MSPSSKKLCRGRRIVDSNLLRRILALTMCFTWSYPRLQANGYTPLLNACVKGHFEVVTELLAKSADVEATNVCRGRHATYLPVWARFQCFCDLKYPHAPLCLCAQFMYDGYSWYVLLLVLSPLYIVCVA